MRKYPYIYFVVFLLLYSCGQSRPIETKVNQSQNLEGMVLIPKGQYLMGGKTEEAYQDELPQHKVQVTSFYMDAHEVTNKQFKAFVDATNYVTVAERAIDWEELKSQVPKGTPKPPDSLLAGGSLIFNQTTTAVDLNQYDLWWDWAVGASWKNPLGEQSDISALMNHPVVHVVREDAQAFCNWSHKRLPTEAEWEWAATGGDDSNKYPWGNASIDKSFDKANFWQGLFPHKNTEKDGYFGTAPVKTYDPNGFGLYDMAGNVWELCSDRYSINTYKVDQQKGIVEDPKGPEESLDPRNLYLTESYVLKGGSFLCNDDYCSGYRVARRMGTDSKSSSMHAGFRCVVSVKPK